MAKAASPIVKISVTESTLAASSKGRAMTLFVSAGRQRIIEKFDAIATKLGGTRTQLIWHYIENAIATGGPKEIKVTDTVRSGVGSSPGFWMTYELAADGSLKGVSVKEVKARSVTTGDSFFRYKKGDKKGRDRTLLKVKQAADFEAKKAKINKVSVTELSGADLQEVLASPPTSKIATDNVKHER